MHTQKKKKKQKQKQKKKNAERTLHCFEPKNSVTPQVFILIFWFEMKINSESAKDTQVKLNETVMKS